MWQDTLNNRLRKDSMAHIAFGCLQSNNAIQNQDIHFLN